MPKINNNPIMKGARGMLGGVVVYRQFRGMTIMSNRPRKPKVITPHQQKIKSRFLLAVEYAKKQIADPVLKARYQPDPGSKFTSAYVAAIADYLRKMKLDGDGNEPNAVERPQDGQHDDSLNRSHFREMQITAENAELIPAEFRRVGTSSVLCDFSKGAFPRASTAVNLVQTHLPHYSGTISDRCATNYGLDPAMNIELGKIDAKTDVSNHSENVKVVEQIKRPTIRRYIVTDTFTQYPIMAMTLERNLTMSRAGPT